MKDVAYTKKSRNSLALFRSSHGEMQTLVNFDMYLSILKSFNDITIQTEVRALNDILSEGINDEDDQAVTLDDAFSFITTNSNLAKKLFTLENFVYKDELKKIKSTVDFFELLKRKKIMLFGLSSMFYSIGFKKFQDKVLKHDNLNKQINKDFFNNSNLHSYLDEYMSALIPRILELAGGKPGILISRNIDSPRNKDFYLILEEAGLDKDKFMTVLIEDWDRITEHSKTTSNYDLMEIVKK